MGYSFSTVVNGSFEDAVASLTRALVDEGFGIVTQIEMDKKFKEMLGKDFKRYTILGACAAAYAFEAIEAEELVGLMLPCNAVAIEQEPGSVLVAVIDPIASMQAIKNQRLESLAAEVTDKLRRVIAALN